MLDDSRMIYDITLIIWTKLRLRILVTDVEQHVFSSRDVAASLVVSILSSVMDTDTEQREPTYSGFDRHKAVLQKNDKSTLNNLQAKDIPL